MNFPLTQQSHHKPRLLAISCSGAFDRLTWPSLADGAAHLSLRCSRSFYFSEHFSAPAPCWFMMAGQATSPEEEHAKWLKALEQLIVNLVVTLNSKEFTFSLWVNINEEWFTVMRLLMLLFFFCPLRMRPQPGDG